MKKSLRLIVFSIYFCFGLLSLSNARADAIPYSVSGTENPDLYSFTATSSGTIGAYFHGSTAAYTNTLSLLVNGVITPESSSGLLNNHTSSIGDFVILGSVNAGDILTFQLNVLSTGDTWYSDKTPNSDGLQHTFSAPFAGDLANGIPAGTYVGFEDLYGGGDFDYDDEAFIFTNISISPVPEPESYIMLIAGLILLVFTIRNRTA
jgi:hypothetical protein